MVVLSVLSAGTLALTPVTSSAQEPVDTLIPRVPLPDSVPRDTVPRDSVPRDTVKAPLAVAPRATTPELGAQRRMVWDRAAIFASGAVTLSDLLALVPGTTVSYSGFMASVTATSWYGEPGRVRVLLDGVELDVLDPRSGGVADLSVVPLWSLEEVAVERAAGELRVHLRSWRVSLTTPETRTDIVTGSENTNFYRGFFGRRSNNGAAFQIAAQQYSTTSARSRGDGDGLGAFTRFGVARGRLSIDAVANRFSRNRTPTISNLITGTPNLRAIPAYKGRDLSAYVRAAWGSPDADGFWMQAIAATVQHLQDADEAGADAVPPTDFDTAVSQAQYVAAAGLTRWGAKLSATTRLRVQGGEQRVSPALRASWDSRWVSLNAFAENEGPDSTSRRDVTLLATPVPWLNGVWSHSVHSPEDEITGGPARTSTRAGAGLRLAGRWVTGGVIRRSISWVPGMPAFGPEFGPVATAEVTGVEGGLSGQIYGPFTLDWRGIRWDGAELYRLPVESRTELRVSTGFPKYFPRGNFHLLASLIHEYRGAFDAPSGAGTQRAEGAGVMSSLLDIRIGTANIFWYNRNFNGKVYETVSGFLMPRMVQLYGVRWSFWN